MQVLSNDVHRNTHALEKATTFSLLVTNKVLIMLSSILCPSFKQSPQKNKACCLKLRPECTKTRIQHS